MRYFVPCLLSLLTCLPLSGTQHQLAADELSVAANQFIDHMVALDFDKATETFDATMSKVMPAAKLEELWKGLLSVNGDLESRGATYREKVASYEILFVPCRFKNQALDVKVVFDQEQRIAGLFFVAPKSERTHRLPAYVDVQAIRELEISVGDDPWKLPATLTLPVGPGPFPAVVLVHGSGPNDRDESILANKPFKDLGMGLATKGIATLRYDKRTKVHGARMVAAKEPLTVKQETLDDVISAVRLLREHAAVDAKRIFVLGHSLGAYLVPRIAAADDEQLIAGFVLLAGNTRPIEDLMWEQVNYILNLDGTLSKEDQAQLAQLKTEIEKVRSADLTDQPSEVSILGARPPYWLDLRGYEPARQALNVKRPMFLLQGERDYQVTMVDFQNWKDLHASRDNVQFKSYPGLNHLFIKGTGGAKSTPTEYSVPGNVEEAVLDDIRRWIDEH